MGDPLEDRLVEILRASPTLMQVLTTLRTLNMPQWRVASGGVYHTVWNALTGRPADYGIRDYDVFYFDSDTSWEAEDAVIQGAAAAFPPLLRGRVEVRNQARVHLWFEAKFGEPYLALTRADEAFERFVCPAFAVGVRLDPQARIDVVAPFGLEDCFAMRLRPNPLFGKNPDVFRRVARSAAERWPELTLEEQT